MSRKSIFRYDIDEVIFKNDSPKSCSSTNKSSIKIYKSDAKIKKDADDGLEFVEVDLNLNESNVKRSTKRLRNDDDDELNNFIQCPNLTQKQCEFKYDKLVKNSKKVEEESLDDIVNLSLEETDIDTLPFNYNLCKKQKSGIEAEVIDLIEFSQLESKKESNQNISKIKLFEDEELHVNEIAFAPDEKTDDFVEYDKNAEIDVTFEVDLAKKPYTVNELNDLNELINELKGIERKEPYKDIFDIDENDPDKTYWERKMKATKGSDWLQKSQVQKTINNLTDFHKDDHGIGKKSHKFSKNGLANQLKKIIDRQKASTNFSKHMVTNKNPVEKKINSINLKVFKTDYLYTHLFFIYGRCEETKENMILLLTSISLSCHNFKQIVPNCILTINPPLRTLSYQSDMLKFIFCSNSIDINTDATAITTIERPKFIHSKFQCSKCRQNSAQEHLCEIYFDFTKVLKQAKLKNELERTSPVKAIAAKSQLYTEIELTQSQDSYQFNTSILDSLERVGFFGRLTFKAVVQRIFMKRDNNSIIRKNVLISDKCNMIAQVQLPIDLEINEGYKYELKGLKVIEKINIVRGSAFEEQVSYLWSRLAKKNDSSCPKIFYLFEFLSESSKLEMVDNSKVYARLNDYEDLKAVGEIEPKVNDYFNLNYAVLLAFNKSYCNVNGTKNHFYEFIISDGREKIFKTSLKDIVNLNPMLIFYAYENYIIEISAKNLRFKQNHLCCNEFTYFDLSRKSDVTTLKLDTILKPLNDKNVESDVVTVYGKVMSVYEDTLNMVIRCFKCNSTDVFKTKNELDTWRCFKCKSATRKPNLKAELNVILNCFQVASLVKMKLHIHTIKKLFNLNRDDIDKEQLTQTTSHLIGKQIGPSYAFIQEYKDSEIFVKELCLLSRN